MVLWDFLFPSPAHELITPTFTSFVAKPEVSADVDGFDSWTSQGVAIPPRADLPHQPLPDWLKHTSLKSPWLYTEKSTGNHHVAYTDIGDLRFVHVDGTCPVPSDHPAIIVNTPANTLHVKLEDFTNTVHPRTIWDNYFSLKNSAPGGNGTKLVSYQKPVEQGVDAAGDSGEGGSADFIPFCFKNVNDIDFYYTKYKLTVESMPDSNDASIVPWKDVIMLRPRPMCDIPTKVL